MTQTETKCVAAKKLRNSDERPQEFHDMRNRLRSLREALELSRPKFSEILDLPPTTLKNFELGYREAGTMFIQKLVSKFKEPQQVLLYMYGYAELKDISIALA